VLCAVLCLVTAFVDANADTSSGLDGYVRM
jgi:hypothetical protein